MQIHICPPDVQFDVMLTCLYGVKFIMNCVSHFCAPNFSAGLVCQSGHFQLKIYLEIITNEFIINSGYLKQE